MVLKTIDAHEAGEPLRFVVAGFPAPRGRTMMEKRDWAARHADHVRRVLMLEPRGHADLCGAVLTEPVSPGSHAGILFMDNDGFSAGCHWIIGATTVALERGLLVPGRDASTVVFDTPAGTIRATARRTGERVERVAYVNVPSFVVQGGVELTLGTRRIRADVAFGGAFYAIVDSESAGVPIDRAHLPELRRLAATISSAVERVLMPSHPLDSRIEGIGGVVFTGPPDNEGSDLKNVTVFAGQAVERSPCGGATAAVMAVVDAMGLLDEERRFVHESVIGTTISGRITARTVVADYPAIVPEIEGRAWITGEHTFTVDEDDPLRDGFRI
jgi:proline racemase